MGESSANDFAHEQGLGREEVAARYSRWAEDAQYDQDLREENYKGPIIVSDVISRLFPDPCQRSDIYILDVAAGSGFVGEKLKERGFHNIDALEPSEGMLKLARAKGIYTSTFQEFLGSDPSQVDSDQYDVACISGGLGEGHIPCSGLGELVRVVKPGGYCVIVMRHQYLETVAEYKGRLEPFMQDLETQCKWTQVERTVVPRYSFHNDGVVFVFKVTGQKLNCN